jgi:hypothetical protein
MADIERPQETGLTGRRERTLARGQGKRSSPDRQPGNAYPAERAVASGRNPEGPSSRSAERTASFQVMLGRADDPPVTQSTRRRNARSPGPGCVRQARLRQVGNEAPPNHGCREEDHARSGRAAWIAPTAPKAPVSPLPSQAVTAAKTSSP